MSDAKAISTAAAFRALIREALPDTSVFSSDDTPIEQLFVPKSHVRALNPNTALVLGPRGTGKSFWWRALQSEEGRAMVERLAPDTKLHAKSITRPGFGEPLEPDSYPSATVLRSLTQNWSARQIWKTVMVWACLERNLLPTQDLWPERVAWVVAEPEAVDRLIYERDMQLEGENRDLIVLFDALDWCSDEWDRLYDLVKGLLQVALEFRASRRIRVKVFLRTDQFDERRVATFPDAAKIEASSVTLGWSSTELFSMFFQMLGRHGKGKIFQRLVEDGQKSLSPRDNATLWEMPMGLGYNPEVQQRAFHALTGPAMGLDIRRGIPYRWLPTHLEDALGQTSPRTFLTALSAATDHTLTHYPEHVWAIHYTALFRGVQKASEIRVQELNEQPWIRMVMEPLKDESVPFAFEVAEALWASNGTFAYIQRQREQALAGEHSPQDLSWLLPAHLEQGALGIREDLEKLGIFHRMRDGRVNMPDVYRVGFGLSRKGGIKPPRS